MPLNWNFPAKIGPKTGTAGHAANAGTNTSGAGGLYPIEARDLIVL